MPSDKDREEARKTREEFERLFDSVFDLDMCSTSTKYRLRSTQVAYENWRTIRDRIRAESKAEALREAAERADAFAVEAWKLPKRERDRMWLAILADKPKPECVWTEDTDGLWKTSCGRSWTFIEGGPKDNRVHYCHGCGKPVRIADEPTKKE